MFKISDGRDKLYQWDIDDALSLVGDKAAEVSEVHFCHKYTQQPLTVAVDHTGEVPIVQVPNILLQKSNSIIVYAYCRGEDAEYTRCDELIKVEPRPKPADYVYTETEVLNYKKLAEQFVAELHENVDTALQEAKESGEFDGADGATFTPSVASDGTLSWTNDKGLDNPESINIMGPQGPAGEKGEKGDTGEQGPQGEQGKTGENGADGKSAYKYAQDGGYTGTEEEFAAKLVQESVAMPSDDDGNADVGTAGQFAVSDGAGGITWLTLANAEEGEY